MGNAMEWILKQKLIEEKELMEKQDIIGRIQEKYNQVELDERMEGLKKAFGVKSPSQEMAKQSRELGEIAQKGFMDGLKNGMDKMDMSTMSRDNHTIIDPLLKEVGQVVWGQQEKVLASGKYPHPIHKDNHTAMEWMDHQMSEFADALVYHQCLKQTIQDVIDDLHTIQDALSFELTDREKGVASIVDRTLDRLERG